MPGGWGGGGGGEAAGLPYPGIWPTPAPSTSPLHRSAGPPPAPSQPDPARTHPGAPRPAPADLPITPAAPSRPGFRGRGPDGRARFRSRPPRGRGPGAPLVHLPCGREWRRPVPQGHLRVHVRGKPAKPRRRQPLAVGKGKMNLPPNGPVGGGCGRGVPGGRAGPGAAAAATAVPSAPLFPFREDPGKAEPGNQEVPRRDTSCRRYGNGPPPPRAAHPGPRLRAAGPARLTGRRQPSPLRPRPPPSWRGPGGPFPAARARCSRVFPPAAGARCQGRRVLAPLPRKRSQERPPGPRGRREREREGPGGTAELGPGAGLRVIARKRQASAGVHWQVEEWLTPGVRSAEQWPRAMGSAARLPRVSFLALLPTSCQSLDTNFLYASVYL